MAVLLALSNRDPQPIQEQNPEVPNMLAKLIHQLLAKKADHRPATADEVVKRLRAIAQDMAIPLTQAIKQTQLLPDVTDKSRFSAKLSSKLPWFWGFVTPETDFCRSRPT